MLAYVLALTVGLGSVFFYTAAFFFPEIHRKSDFIWSGVGAFYALVLWIFAPRITGGLLLGHIASVTLLGWLAWQTLSLRRQLTPTAQQTQVPDAEQVKTNIQQQVSQLPFSERLAQFQMWFRRTFIGVQDKVQPTGEQKTPPTSTTSPPAPAPKPTVEVIDDRTSPTETTVPELTPPNPPPPELVEAAQETAEDKATPPITEIAPDASLAPPAEAPPGQVPPNPPEQS